MRLRAVLGVIVVEIALSAAPQNAYASGVGDQQCPHGGNPGSTACLIGVVTYGTYAEYHSNNLVVNGNAEAAGYHANQSVWAYGGAPCTNWVEEGVTQGFQGEIAYEWYDAYNVQGNYMAFRAGYTSPDGYNHAYRLQYQSDNGTYSIFRDGALVRGGIAGVGAGTCISQAGSEFSAGTPLINYHSDTFDFIPLQWQDTGYGTHSGWNTSQYWIDSPCGAQSIPYCNNGNYYAPTHWANNKPS